MDIGNSNSKWIIDEPVTIAEAPPLCLCLEYRTVEINGQEIHLTTKEFDFLALLMLNPKRVFTYDMLSDLIWGDQDDVRSRRTIINHIGNLRRKLNANKGLPDFIKSVPGVGYKFDAPVAISTVKPE